MSRTPTRSYLLIAIPFLLSAFGLRPAQAQAPSPPTNLLTQGTTGSVALTWTGVGAATSYDVYRSTTSGGETLYASGITPTGYTDASVTSGPRYFYTISAVDSGGTSTQTAQSGTYALAAPTGVSAYAGNGAINLSWTAVTNAGSYRIYRSLSPGGEGSPTILDVVGLSYVDTGLTNSTTYYYKVTALQGAWPSQPAAESALSSEVSGTPSSTLPLAPTGVTAVPGSTNVVLTWSTALGATSYNVIRSTANGGPYTTLSSPTSTNYTDGSPSGSVTYYYAIAAVDTAGTSANSAQVAADASSVTPLTDLADTYSRQGVPSQNNGGDGSLWTDSTSGSNRNIYLRFDLTGAAGVISAAYLKLYENTGSSGTEDLDAVSDNTWTEYGLDWTNAPSLGSVEDSEPTGSAGYVIFNVGSYVEAQQAASAAQINMGLTETTASGTIQFFSREEGQNPPLLLVTVGAPLAPTGLTAAAGSTIGDVVLNWTASSGATAYNIYRSTTSGGEGATPIYTGVTGSSYTDTGLYSGMTYYYEVTGVDQNGEGSKSNEASSLPCSPLIDSGSSSAYVDSEARTWVADTDYSGGSALTTASTITGTSDETLYQAQRSGSSFNYVLPVHNGRYAVTLYFAEIDPSITGAGQRVFSVTANSNAFLTAFDIYNLAGGQNKAISRTGYVNVSTGDITLAFSASVDTPAVAAIQVVSVSAAADVPPPGWATGSVPTDSGTDAGGNSGPGSSLAVSLPSLVLENSPGADIWAYNPLGPPVSYTRFYRSALATNPGHTNSYGLSPGWTDNYDIQITSGTPTAWTSTFTLTYPNSNDKESFTPVLNGGGTPTGAFVFNSIIPTGAPYMVTGVWSGTTGQWTSITITGKDLLSTVFTPAAISSTNPLYLVEAIQNSVGQKATITRDPTNGNRMEYITNTAGTTLLYFHYSGTQLLNVQDLESSNSAENREVAYTFDGDNNLEYVTEISATGATGVPNRWDYGYEAIGGNYYLNSVAAPDPSNPGSSTTSMAYYSGTQVSSVTDAASRTRKYAPLLGGTSVEVDNSGGSVAETWTQNYGNAQNVNTGFADAQGNTESHTYGDSTNPYQPTVVTDRNSETWQVLTEDAYGNPKSLEDPRGDFITNTYDSSIFPFGELLTTKETHETGCPSSCSVDATRQATTLTYYQPGDGIINGLLETASIPTPDTSNGATTVTTTYYYTTTASSTAAGGNISSIVAPGNNSSATLTTTFGYTSDSLYSSACVSGTSYSQDEYEDEPLTVEDATTIDITHYRYDGRGNVACVVDPKGNVTSYTYNLADQLLQTTYATGDYELNHYQYVGGPMDKAQVYDSSSTLQREVDYTYTPEGEVAGVTGSTQPASYTYDGRGRLLTLTDGNSDTTTYAYDTVGNLSSITYPNYSGTFDVDQFTSYDADQNLLTEVDGRGVTKTYTRSDPESMVTNIHYSTLPAGVTSISDVNYSYDNFGRLSSMGDGTGSQAYTYDDLDELESLTRDFTSGPQNQVFNYTHYADSSPETLEVPTNVSNPMTSINSGDFSFGYDAAQRLTQVNVPFTTNSINGSSGDYLGYDYYKNGWVNDTYGLQMGTSGTHGASTDTTYDYNGRGFVTDLKNEQYKPSTNTLPTTSEFNSMTYDSMGNRLGETASIPDSTSGLYADHTATYSYDTGHGTASDNRDVLTGEASALSGSGSSSYDDVYTNSFGYDSAFNDTSFSLTGTGKTFGFNIDNQLDNSGFTFDGSGNPTTYGSGTFSFDPEDRLTAMPAATFSAGYDGNGLRAWKTETVNSVPGTTYFLYDGDKPIVEETFSGSTATISAVNVWGADGWRARYYPVGSPNFYSFTFDPQGNVIEKQQAINTTIPAYTITSFEAYGKFGANLLYSTGVSEGPGNLHRAAPAGFGGEWGYYTDETGYVNLTHRYYDPNTGRFINRDPIGYNGGVNLYELAGGNPVNAIDPSGLTVSAIFDRAAGTLQIWDDSNPNDKITLSDVKGSKDKSKSQAVFSGEGQYMNDPNSEQVPSMGPIPAGEYLISHMFVAGDMGKHFQLYSKATGWQYHGNRTWLNHFEGTEAPGRHNFNFHAGHLSEGCVTIWSTVDKGQPGYPDSPTWENILSLMRRSGTTSGGYTYANGKLTKGWHWGGEFVAGTYFGTLTVK